MSRSPATMMRYLGAVLLGMVLFTFPFVRYGFGGDHAHAAGPHMDHGPRHGGHLVMLRNAHVELIDNRDHVEVYLSDAKRRPVRPTSCEAAFDGAAPQPCEWRRYRSVVAKPKSALVGRYAITTNDGSRLELKYP